MVGIADGVEVGGIIVGVLSEPGWSGLKDGQDGVVVFGVGGVYNQGLDSESWFSAGGNACLIVGK